MAWVTPLTGSPANALAQEHANLLLIDTCHIGSAAPTTDLNEGRLWLDNSSDPHVLKIYSDRLAGTPAWNIVNAGVDGDMDFLLNQIINGRLENTGSAATPASGNVGYVYLHTGSSVPQVVISATKFATFMVGDTSQFFAVPIPPNDWIDDDGTPPTKADIAMTTSGNFRGKQFDAVAERMSVQVEIPPAWNTTADPVLRVRVLIETAAASANEDIDVEIDWNRVRVGNGDLATKASVTKLTPYDIGSNNAQYTLHEIDFALDRAASGNELLVGDYVNIEFGLTNLDEVDSIIFVGAKMRYPMGTTIFEA